MSDHKAMSCRIRIQSSVDLGNVSLDYDHVGMNTPVEFMKKISVIDKFVTSRLNGICEQNNTIVLSTEEEEHFQDAEKCCFCNRDLGDDRVRDHDHYTGKYFGEAHNECNLEAKQTKITIPCFFTFQIMT